MCQNDIIEESVYMTQAQRAVALLNEWLLDESLTGPPDTYGLLNANYFDYYEEILGPSSDDPDVPTIFITLLTFKDGSQCGLVLRESAREVWSVLY